MRTNRLRSVKAIGLAGLLVLGAAACGGDDDDSADTPSTEAAGGADTAPEATEPAGSEETTPAGSNDTTPAVGSTPITEPIAETVAPGPEPVRGGSATMVATAQVVRLDPQLQRVSFAFTDPPFMAAVYGHLAYLDPATGALQLYFLESLEPNDDYTVWTLKLHPGMKFSDDTPFDAEAIAYNIRRAADEETGSRFKASAQAIVDGLNVVDDVTLEVTLPASNANWYATLVSDFAGIGSPTAMEQAKADGVEFGTVPVGAGPFMVKEWDPGQHLVVERNPNFELFKPGQPYLDEITFETQPDQVQQLSALQSGSADLASPNGAGNVFGMEDVANVIVTQGSGGSDLFMNMEIAPFNDIRARQAIWYALDQTAAADAFAAGTPPVRTLFAEGSPFYNADFQFPEQNKEEAQRLFDELAAEGTPVSFEFLAPDTASQAAFIDYMIGQFAQYQNVTFTPRVVPSADYTNAIPNSEFQMLPHGLYFANPIPTVVDYFHPDGLLNSSNWVNETVREALDGLPTATTVEEQKAIWDTVQEEFLKDLPLYMVGQSVIGFAYSDDFIVPRTINYGNIPLWAEIGRAG